MTRFRGFNWFLISSIKNVNNDLLHSSTSVAVAIIMAVSEWVEAKTDFQLGMPLEDGTTPSHPANEAVSVCLTPLLWWVWDWLVVDADTSLREYVFVLFVHVGFFRIGVHLVPSIF